MNEGYREKSYSNKRKKIKKSGNRLLYSFIVIFLLGYGIFFSSKLWLKAPYEGVPITPIGKAVTEEDRVVTIDSWKYSKEDKKMEIIVTVENLSLDGIDSYKWSVKTASGSLNTKVVSENKDFTVLHVSDVPRRWTEVALVMEMKPEDKSKGSDFKLLKLYTNEKHVKAERHIKKKSTFEYKKEQGNGKIDNYKNQLKELKKQKKSIESSINNADKKIKELTDDMKYQTGQEQMKTGEQISGFEGEKESLKEKLEDKKKEIKEMRDKIHIQEKLLKNIS